MSDGIQAVLEEILVDANGDDERPSAFGQAFDPNALEGRIGDASAGLNGGLLEGAGG